MDWIFEINDDGTMTQVYENLRYIEDGDLTDLLLSGPDDQVSHNVSHTDI